MESKQKKTGIAKRAPASSKLSKEDQAYQRALRHFNKNPDWVTFFRDVLGIHGTLRKLFPKEKQWVQFQKTPQYRAIQQMLVELRRTTTEDNKEEPVRVITIRLPQCLHESLIDQAGHHGTSMNQLCISKLLRIIEVEEEKDRAKKKAKRKAKVKEKAQ